MEDDVAGRQIAKARALIDAGNYDGAIAELRAALSSDPERAYARALLAACHLDKGEPETARKEAEAALGSAPDLILAHHVVGLAELAADDFTRAEAAFNTAASIDPQSAETQRLLALLYYQQAKHADAERHFEEALRLEPDNASVISSYADFLTEKGDPEAAAALLEAAPDYVRDSASMLIVRGKLAFRRGDLDEARDLALWVLQHDAQNPAAVRLLCETKIRKNPLMAIWLRYANFMNRFDGKTRILIMLGLWLGVNILSRTVLSTAAQGVQIAVSGLWLGFCLLTWIGPAVLGAMVQRELKAVKLKNTF